MAAVVIFDPVPAAPGTVGVREFIGGDAGQLGPGSPIVLKGTADVIGAIGLVDGRIAPIELLVKQIAGLAEEDRRVGAAPVGQHLYLWHVTVDGHLSVDSLAAVDVQFRRVIARVGVCGPSVESPDAVGHGAEHGVHECRWGDVSAGRHRPVEDDDPVVAAGHAADGSGGLFQELAIFGGVGRPAPLQVQVGFVPDLDVKFMSIPTW